MRIDLYTRGVLTIIAIALLYLCILFTPLPTVSAQRGLRPGDDTGPAQVVIVGWRAADPMPVQLAESIPLRVSGDVSINGLVETRSAANAVARVVLTGWEESSPGPVQGQSTPSTFRPLNSRAQSPTLRGVPVTAYPPY
jgi:hypothetical protein